MPPDPISSQSVFREDGTGIAFKHQKSGNGGEYDSGDDNEHIKSPIE